jgi:predicted peptidase
MHTRVFAGRRQLFVALFVAAVSFVQAASPPPGGLHSRSYKDSQGVEYKYVLYVPYKLQAGSRPPLLMFLHGSGERGDNGIDQIMVGLGPALWKQKANFPFVTILPQCHTNSNWLVDGPDGQAALAILKETAAEFQTDPDRVYLTGLSMGGSGTWSIAAKHPDMFAAIVPMCGRGDLESARTLAAARLPVWNFCGDKDREATVKFCRDMHAALQAAGGHSRYTEYPGVGHNCWDNAYGTAELYPWLLDQSRAKNRKPLIQ